MSAADTGVTPEAVFSHASGIVPRRIAGETILVAVRGELARLERLHVLNVVGEHIWGLLDAKRSVAEVSADVTATFDVDAATALRDVTEFLADLEDAGLVTPATADR